MRSLPFDPALAPAPASQTSKVRTRKEFLFVLELVRRVTGLEWIDNFQRRVGPRVLEARPESPLPNSNGPVEVFE